MTKFKPGDRVKVVANAACALGRGRYGYHDGENFTVRSHEEIRDGLECITVKESGTTCNNTSHLTLVEAESVAPKERYQETGWMVCPTNSTPHINCTEAHGVKLFIKGPPPHKHTFALICTGCGCSDVEAPEIPTTIGKKW